MCSRTKKWVRIGLWLVLANILCFHVLWRLVKLDGASDGTLYAGIARNLADGRGAPWHLKFSESFFPYFTEHPPLMIWIEAILFSLFGDTLAVEKTFSLLLLFMNGVCVAAIWRELSRGSRYQYLDIVALILTLIAGRIGYAFSSALMENLQMIFTALAVLCVIGAYRESVDSRHRLFLMVVSGILIELALLTKGPVGLFPLTAPVLYWIAFRSQRPTQVLLDMAVIALTVLALSYVLLAFAAPREYLAAYFHGQFVASLSGARGGAGFFGSMGVFLPIFLYPCLVAAFFLGFSHLAGRSVPIPGCREAHCVRPVSFYSQLAFLHQRQFS
jgi:4-amino-4-deoxy-L-arabinose transferase-like glycosyltransferase